MGRSSSQHMQLMETRFVLLPWNLFWPNLAELALLNKVLSEGAAESAPLITQIVVRNVVAIADVARRLHRRVCFFSTVPSRVLPAAEEYQKQAIYVRTQLALMLRNTNERKWAIDFYKDMIRTVNAIVISRGDTSDQPACLPRELTAFWAYITDAKFGASKSAFNGVDNL
uniref:Epg5-like central TPR repeats domain-containing protein n=1 Tax=Parascaris equorum TaxID=6256 RepID=A0A914RVV3_PAREQ